MKQIVFSIRGYKNTHSDHTHDRSKAHGCRAAASVDRSRRLTKPLLRHISRFHCSKLSNLNSTLSRCGWQAPSACFLTTKRVREAADVLNMPLSVPSRCKADEAGFQTRVATLALPLGNRFLTDLWSLEAYHAQFASRAVT